MRIRSLIRGLRVLLVAVLIMLLLTPEWSASANEVSRLKSIVRSQEFDYLVWESNAFLNKGEGALAAGHHYLTEEARKQLVLDYLEQIRQIQLLEGEMFEIYGDPDIVDPGAASRGVKQELESLRSDLEDQQPLVEAIIQNQLAAVLVDEGLAVFGQAWPPVVMQLTPLPSLLVVSPRDHIEQIYQVSLVDGLSTADKEAMESAVFDQLDRSALVVPLGGIGTFPAMIVETADLNRLLEVVAHEWTHHWLTLKPLGFSYFLDPDVRIINETVASLVDQELGSRVVERFYPEFLPPEEEIVQQQLIEPDPERQRPEFDFQTELANTRVRTEELLANGRIEEAEEYMEDRRQQFRDHGYYIRKINQAFFAFYGAYAAEPGGAQGENPIGPMLREIREQSPSVSAFLQTVAPVTSLAGLVEVYEQTVTSASQD